MQRFREHKEFLFIAGLALGDLIYTTGYVAASIRRIVDYYEGYDKEDLRTTKAECVRDFPIIIFHIGMGVVGEMPLFAAIDRLVAILFPIWHYKQHTWYPAVMCSIPIINATVMMVINYYFVMMYSSAEIVFAMCFDSSIYYEPFRPIFAIHRWGSVILSAFIYVYVSIMLYKKFSGANNVKALNKHQRRKIMQATVTMGLSTVNAVLLMLIPDMLLYFRVFTSSSVFLLLYSLILNKIMVNFVLFVTRHHEFRRVFIGMFNLRKKENIIIRHGWSSTIK